jgi:iron complex outermembrane receptor protein
MPSVVTTSDAGNGFGYTGIRVRGSDATRVNVTHQWDSL